MAFHLVNSFILKKSYETQTPIDEEEVERKFGKKTVEELNFFHNSYEEYCQKLYLQTGLRYCLDFQYPVLEYHPEGNDWVPVSSELHTFSTFRDPNHPYCYGNDK
jgi:hypothetical protein